MVACDIKFDNNPQGIYYAGQSLSGVVELNNEKARKIRGVTLRIEGFAKCKWTESEGSGKHRRTVNYSGREDYINTFSYLIGSFQVSQTEITQGMHKFNFSCFLPPQLPTSFESKYGYIRYQVKVEMERPWKFDHKFSFGFTVIKVLDLNYGSPGLRSPMKAEVTKSFFFGLSSKTLFLSAEIPVAGFVAGQSVPISVRITNDSNVDVEETRMALKKIIFYNSQTPRRKTRERVEMATEIVQVGVPAKSKGTIEGLIIIPPVPPSNQGTCSVVQVSYEIRVCAKVGGIHRSPVVRLPVTIGTVPLQFNYQSLPSNYNMHAGSSTQHVVSAPLPDYSSSQAASSLPDASHQRDLPPPSYHQAMGMSSSDTADAGEALTEDKPFSPMYPVFNFAGGHLPPQQTSSDQPPSYGFVPPQYTEKR